MNQLINTTTLYYRSGSSDKFYTISIVENPDGTYSVPFTYGRRSTSGKSGYKCENVSISQADNMYDKMVSQKTGKGYTPGPAWMTPKGNPPSGTVQSAPAAAPKASTVKEPKRQPKTIDCQLLNTIENDEALKVIQDDSFCAQEKHDGKRRLIQYEDGTITGYNRKGQAVGYIQTLDNDLTNIANHSGIHSFLIDGEEVGEHYYVFDILKADGSDLRWKGYVSRLSKLEELLSSCSTNYVHVVETAHTFAQKAAMLDLLAKENKEGIVFKRSDAQFTAGKPASGGDQLKYKFYSTASCMVARVNTKRSVALQVLDGKTWIDVGNCTIPPNKDVPAVNDVVEIRYLYAYKGGSLYQPTYLGLRDDIDVNDCIESQLKYKAAA
jgi:bifunctional non-homologous end joining protein LigD